MRNTRKISLEPNRVGVLNIFTSSLSVRFLEGRAEYFDKKGFEFSVVSSPGEELARAKCRGVPTVAVPMAREISPIKDLLSLWRLVRTISRLHPTITNVGTPKGGLLGGIAAWICRVPCRIYSLYGLRCETTTGLKRWLLVLAERVACLCAHRVFCVSESLRQSAIDQGIVDADRCFVLASGSCNGIDAERFGPTAEVSCRAEELRRQLGIPREAPVVGFVGRLTRDKGIPELVEAYLRLREGLAELRLLLVGELEEADPLPSETRRRIEREPQIVHTGFVDDPVPYYHIMDVLAFPTHREGFPNAVLEAHAAGKPIVAARATGVVDAVINGVTGILVPVGDARALADGLQLVLEDQNLAAALGAAGRNRVLREFKQETVWDAIVEEYLQILTVKGFCIPSAITPKAFASAAPSGPIVSR